MDKKEKDELNKKIKLYKYLGAEKFQKVVFTVEKIKFKLLKKLFPNFLKHFDKYLDYKKKNELKKAKTDEEKKEIIKKYKLSKMAIRKEFYQEKNRNYHIDENKPTEIYKYLEWNKSVHKKGLIKNLILIPLLTIGVISNYPIAVILLIIELISTTINLECINIQNYNICRYKKAEEVLKKQEQRKIESNIEKYGQAAELIHKSIEENDDIPDINQVINNITNKEQLMQMKELLLKAKKEREKNNKEVQENRGNKVWKQH